MNSKSCRTSPGFANRHDFPGLSAVILAGNGRCPATTLASHNVYLLIIVFDAGFSQQHGLVLRTFLATSNTLSSQMKSLRDCNLN